MNLLPPEAKATTTIAELSLWKTSTVWAALAAGVTTFFGWLPDIAADWPEFHAAAVAVVPPSWQPTLKLIGQILGLVAIFRARVGMKQAAKETVAAAAVVAEETAKQAQEGKVF